MTEDRETEEEREEERVESRRPLAAVQTFEVVRRTGLEELERPAGSLFLSGLAAGLAVWGWMRFGRPQREDAASGAPADPGAGA